MSKKKELEKRCDYLEDMVDELLEEKDELQRNLGLSKLGCSELMDGNSHLKEELIRITNYGFRNIPRSMRLALNSSGCTFGISPGEKIFRVGIDENTEGNIAVFGTNGSSKTQSVVCTTLLTYKGIVIGNDIKCEIGEKCIKMNRNDRRSLLFGPSNKKLSYDVYYRMKKDRNMIQCAYEIANAIIPKPIDTKDGYWIDMARTVQAAIIIYCFIVKKFDFAETMLYENTHSLKTLLNCIQASSCVEARYLISDITNLKKEHICSIASEMKRHTAILATDPDIQDAFSINNKDEDTEVFSWDCTDLVEAPNVFLCINQNLLEQWEGVLRLMVTQLIRHLEQRPDKYSEEGVKMNPVLLLLDEFPMLGKMDVVTNAVTTLRSRRVSFMLVFQSLTQLDLVYGEDIRKIIMDNCQYKIILKLSEPESQEYLSRLIGQIPICRKNLSANYSTDGDILGYGIHVQEIRTQLISPELFAINNNVWIHTPYGFICGLKTTVDKLEQLQNSTADERKKLIDLWYKR